MAEEKKWLPTMSGTMPAYKPQWRHSVEINEAINKNVLKMDGGKDWTNVPFDIIRGGLVIKLPSGEYAPVGVPFPRFNPGIYETIWLCGEEQAWALAWAFAAHVAGVGGEVEVRIQEYDLHYEIKARVVEADAKETAVAAK